VTEEAKKCLLTVCIYSRHCDVLQKLTTEINHNISGLLEMKEIHKHIMNAKNK